MNDVTLEIPEPVRLKALSIGRAGETWLDDLTGLVADLAAAWELSVGRTLTGGTEAFVAEAMTAKGRKAVLKISLPELDPHARELNTMLAAAGRGYAEVYRYDQAHGVMLLERLGPKLNELGWSVDAQICATLETAWRLPPQGAAFMTGAEKAAGLGDFIETTWAALERPCAERTIAMALHYADLRRRSFDPDLAVLAHGDAHAWNTLLVLGAEPARFKFVDPDGILVERAYDLGISMREWTSELSFGDPLELGRRRCRRLAKLAGVDPEPIWQWGFLERVSTGLLFMKVGLDGARAMLAVADAWARGGAA